MRLEVFIQLSVLTDKMNLPGGSDLKKAAKK